MATIHVTFQVTPPEWYRTPEEQAAWVKKVAEFAGELMVDLPQYAVDFDQPPMNITATVRENSDVS